MIKTSFYKAYKRVLFKEKNNIISLLLILYNYSLYKLFIISLLLKLYNYSLYKLL